MVTSFYYVNPLHRFPGPFGWYNRLKKPIKIEGLINKRKYVISTLMKIDIRERVHLRGGSYGSKVYVKDGFLYVRKGFYFDGASGPAMDLHTNMLAALVHDLLYYLLAHGCTDFTYAEADALYRDIMIAQGAWKVRAYTHYVGLRGFAWIWRMFSKEKEGEAEND